MNDIKDPTKIRIDNEAERYVEENSHKLFDELCFEITISELNSCIKLQKTNKSPGVDLVLSEMLKSGGDAIKPILFRLFNLIPTTENFPDSWRCNTLTPIFKKGDRSVPENYRGIAVSSILCKLFLTILHARLEKYVDGHNIIPKCQLGYKKLARTSDHIMTLKTLIDKYVKKGTGSTRGSLISNPLLILW